MPLLQTRGGHLELVLRVEGRGAGGRHLYRWTLQQVFPGENRCPEATC